MRPTVLLPPLIILLITLVLLEVVSLFGFSAFTGKELDRKGLAAERENRLQAIQDKLDPEQEVAALYRFHPYVGYPGQQGYHPWGKNYPPFNTYGLLSVASHGYPYKKQGDEIVVGVVGGSVADMFANLGEKYVNRLLAAKGEPHSRVVLLNLATGGYKQPQQLFQAQYAAMSGFELDVILNLDGFNDLALAVQNIEAGINPLYPSGFHMGLMSRLSSGLDKGTVQDLADFYRLYEEEAALLRGLNGLPFRYSAFANLAGEILRERKQVEISRLEYRMTREGQKNVAVEFRGPPLAGSGHPDTDVIRIWQQGSRFLHAFAREQGLVYIHALQPNQYLEGSKPLSAKEREIAYNPENPWGITAKRGYGKLREAGQALQQEGVPFYDLSQIFRDNGEDIYTDDCCHFWERGNEILAHHLTPIIEVEIHRQWR